MDNNTISEDLESEVIFTTSEQIAKSNNGKIYIYLESDSWNDYGYKTTFTVYLYKNQEKIIELGKIKIAEKDQQFEHTYKILPEIFTELTENFCSIGDDYYYSNLKKCKLFDITLSNLRDILYNPTIIDSFSYLDIFEDSIARYGLVLPVVDENQDIFNKQEIQKHLKESYSELNVPEDEFEPELSIDLQDKLSNGMFIRWVKNLSLEIRFLEKTSKYKEEQMNKYRISAREIKKRPRGKNYWARYHQERLKSFIENYPESESESEEEMKGNNYTDFKSFSILSSKFYIDDYRYSSSDYQIGVILNIPEERKIPFFVKNSRRTGYTEFIETKKEDDFRYAEGYEDEMDNPSLILTGKQSNISSIQARMQDIYGTGDSNNRESSNEALFRYKPSDIFGIIIDREISKEKSKQVLFFLKHLNRINPSCKPNIYLASACGERFNLTPVDKDKIFDIFSKNQKREIFQR